MLVRSSYNFAAGPTFGCPMKRWKNWGRSSRFWDTGGRLPDYCNPLYYGLPKFQINRLQHIQNALARTVVQAPKFKHITPILKSLHWLKVSERIEYKITSLTYKILNTTQPLYLYDLVSIQPPHGHNTRSSPYVTLIKPSSSLKVTHRSFRHASPHLWNQLPTLLRILHPIIHPFLSDHHLNMPV